MGNIASHWTLPLGGGNIKQNRPRPAYRRPQGILSPAP